MFPVELIVGTTSVESVSTALPSVVNVARASIGTSADAAGLTGIKVNCQVPGQRWFIQGLGRDKLPRR